MVLADTQASRLRVRVISVSSRDDRRQHITANLRDWNLRWEFFDALTSDHHRYAYDEERAKLVRGCPLSGGERGCFGSHVACMIDFVENSSDDFLLVIEDDVILDTNFDYGLVVEWMGKLKIDYLRLYSRYTFKLRGILEIGRRQLIRFKFGPFGTQAYIISRSGAAQFLSSMSRCERPIDDELDRFWHHDLPPYAIFPYPVLEIETASTLGRSANPMLETSFSHKMVKRVERIQRRIANISLRARDRAMRRAYLRLRE
jgi:glycosyl transferase, family 25